MYSHLSKREKRRRLAQARNRALMWSVQEQTKAAFKKKSSKKQATSTSTVLPITHRETLPLSPNSYYTPISLTEDNTNTVKAIQDTLQDLQEQRQAINITIDVLQYQLQFLLSTGDCKPPSRR